MSDEGWQKALTAKHNFEILKQGTVCRNATCTDAGKLGSRRLLLLCRLVDPSTDYKSQFVLTYLDGDESDPLQPKEVLPLFGASITNESGALTVTVSKTDFADFAGNPLVVSSEGDGKDLNDWCEALCVKGIPFLAGAWQSPYSSALNVEVLRDGYAFRDVS